MMESTAMFYGHTLGYWINLENKAKDLDCVRLLEENYKLLSKVNFYETRLKEMIHILEK